MNKKVAFYIIGLLILAGIVAAFGYSQGWFNKNQIVLYYSRDCPHCKLVEEFIAQNNIAEKVAFAEKEVSNSQTNANQMFAKAKICELPSNQIGVPFLWTGSFCLIGDKDIINFFKEKADVK